MLNFQFANDAAVPSNRTEGGSVSEPSEELGLALAEEEAAERDMMRERGGGLRGGGDRARSDKLFKLVLTER
jgi:hypothetical protein